MNQSEPVKEFRIEHHGAVEEVTGRQNAVRRAKRLSEQRHGTVNVERTDGVVRMQFRNGDLETMVRETRRHRRNRR